MAIFSGLNTADQLLDYDALLRHINSTRENTAKVGPARPPNCVGDLRDMLHSRMRWGSLPAKFKQVHPVQVTDDLVIVLVVLEKSYVVIEDSGDLYPSDALITKLRTLT